MSIQGIKRLSGQSLGPDPRVLEAVRRGKPAVFKVVDPDPGWVGALRAASPDTVLIGRIVDDSLSGKLNAPEGRAFAERVLNKAAELGGAIRWWEGSNEAAVGPDPIRRLCDFERAFAARLQSEGHHALVGGFSTGTPQIVGPDSEVPWMGEWELFYPAMREAHGVHFREYWHPHQLDDTWNAFRFLKWWPALPDWARAKWWLVGELGIDGGLARDGRKGWSAYGHVPLALYLELLRAYAQTMARFPQLAATIYIAGLGADHSWSTFDIAGELMNIVSGEWAAAPAEPWGSPAESPVEGEEEVVTPEPLLAPGARNLVEQLAVREGTRGYEGHRSLNDVDMFVIHWLGARGRNLRPETVWSEQVSHQDPDRPKFPAGAYHFQITQDGTLTQLHRLTTITWQSAGEDDVTGRQFNDISVALAMEPKRENEDYHWTQEQISTCLGLYDWLCRRLGRQLRVAGHYEIRPLTPEGLPSTECPGPAWPIQLKPLLLDRDPDQPSLAPWEEATRVAWQSVVISHNPEFAFPSKASQVLGAEAFALTPEGEFKLGDNRWQYQLWSNGSELAMLLTVHGQWALDDIQVVELPAVSRTSPPLGLIRP